MIKMEGQVARKWIDQMSTYQTLPKPRSVDAVQVPQDFLLVQDGDAPITGTLRCKAGCWLVMSPQGTLYAVPPGVFEQQYKEYIHERVEGITRT